MPSQTQDTFNVAKEAKHAAHEALSEREAQGLERNGPLEQTAARSVEGTARKFYGTSSSMMPTGHLWSISRGEERRG